jgi:hypothetical protein
MTYFADLTNFSYHGVPQPGVLNVGWLAMGEPLPVGETPTAFLSSLSKLCAEHTIHSCWGHHVCEFCPNASWDDPYFYKCGNGEIWVRSAGGVWYAAPRMIEHYVLTHNYRPPQEFVDTILNPSEIGIDETRQNRPLSDAEELAQSRAYERRQRETRGPPMLGLDIDRIVQQGILATTPKKRRWWMW